MSVCFTTGELSVVASASSCAHRDKAAARRYFEKAIDRNGEPETITVDKSGANLAALEARSAQCGSLNTGQGPTEQVPEQRRRGGSPCIKCIIKPMMGFKDFRCARIILAGIEVMHMIRKGQMRDGGIARNPAEKFYSVVI